MPELQQYVDTWWHSIGDLLTLLDGLPAAAWEAPTDLAGWDVRAVASHVAHLEGLLGGAPREQAEVPEAPHITGQMGRFTEIGVITRRGVEPAAIIEEIRRYSAARCASLQAEPPTDPDAPAPGVFGAIGWTTGRLLRNRPLDVWMHEQDVRRAVGQPGNLDTPGARHSATYLLESLGFVLGKRVQAAPGITLVAHVDGHPPTAVAVDDQGRGITLPHPPDEPTVTLRMDRETFVVLAGGRRPAAAANVTVEGDRDLGARFLQSLAVTP